MAAETRTVARSLRGVHRRTVHLTVALTMLIPLVTACDDFNDGSTDHQAEHYADAYDVSMDEARRRVELRRRTASLEDGLRDKARDHFGGYFWEHEPTFRLVVLMTNGDEAPVRQQIDDPDIIEVLDVRRADATIRELERNHQEVAALARELDTRASPVTNIPANQVEFHIDDVSALEDALDESGTGLPEHVAVFEDGEKVDTLDDD